VTRFRALKVAKVAGTALIVVIALDLVATAATLAIGYKVMKP
jgi:hypothetical protein